MKGGIHEFDRVTVPESASVHLKMLITELMIIKIGRTRFDICLCLSIIIILWDVMGSHDLQFLVMMKIKKQRIINSRLVMYVTVITLNIQTP